MKLLKKVGIIVLVLALISIPVFSFASDPTDPETWKQMQQGNDDSGIAQVVNNAGTSAISIIRSIGMFVALGMLIWIGIKWITSTAQERADLKGKAVNYVIGAVFIFGASFILPLIVNFINDTLG